MALWRWRLLIAAGLLGLASMAAHIAFIHTFHRFPHGGGEVVNWVVGL